MSNWEIIGWLLFIHLIFPIPGLAIFVLMYFGYFDEDKSADNDTLDNRELFLSNGINPEPIRNPQEITLREELTQMTRDAEDYNKLVEFTKAEMKCAGIEPGYFSDDKYLWLRDAASWYVTRIKQKRQ